MRYPASEKLEIIHLVERSHLGYSNDHILSLVRSLSGL